MPTTFATQRIESGCVIVIGTPITIQRIVAQPWKALRWMGLSSIELRCLTSRNWISLITCALSHCCKSPCREIQRCFLCGGLWSESFSFSFSSSFSISSIR
jgi:hypothetical protein